MRKNIKKLLREGLGIPEGILEESVRLYNIIMEELNSEDKDTLLDEYEYSIDEEFNIGKDKDFTIDGINFTIDITRHENVEKPMIVSFGFGSSHQIELDNDNTARLVHRITDNINLLCSIVVSNDTTFSKIIDLFEEYKDKIISSLSHELKHSYDHYKKQKDSVYRTSMYQAYSGARTGLKPIDRFMHNMYFIHAIENLVRPSEIGSLIKTKGVKQKDFLEFLTNNDTYQRLVSLSNFSVEELKEELKNHIPEIDIILKNLNEPTNISDDEKVEKMLKIAYLTLLHIKSRSVFNTMGTPIENIIGALHPNKMKFFNKVVNKVNRFKSYKDFFDYEEKMFKFVSRRMIKKLSKLYAMTDTNESILEWDLYHDFVKESKYIKPKPVKKPKTKN
jgi:hypothetical protein